MDSVRAWKPSGDVKYSAVAVRRAVSSSPSGCRTSTQAPNDGTDFPRRHRLTRGADIQTVIREGKRIRTVHLDVRIHASPLGVSPDESPRMSRVGIIVPRHQHSAVDRNLLKRRLRELTRVHLLPSLRTATVAGAGGIDIAIRARREAYGATFDQLHRDIQTVVDRAPGMSQTFSDRPTDSETQA